MAHRFPIGTPVRIRAAHRDDPEPRHVRTPWYLRGKRGIVARQIGVYRNPEDLSEGRYDGPGVPLYWVQLTMDELWAGNGHYAAADTLAVEIYEHWLEPAEATQPGARP